jgi:hypothetical protein
VRGRVRPCRLALGLGILLPALAEAQISPGRLARGHAPLEGSGRCFDCHVRGEGPSPEKCLACHTLLRERVEAKRGLHARPEYADCKTCHIDHQGADFDLVYWGKEGRATFDHALTGHPLEGRHRALACESCHTARFNRHRDRLAAGKASERTFLGLDTACASCHEDAHRGTRFASRECTSCHTPERWKPVARFDHAVTGFPLSGRHASAACEKCHRGEAPPLPVPTSTGVRRVLRATPGRDCANCHDDVHAGKLGANCASCHGTASWRGEGGRRAGGAFDHDRTGYRLEGRHQSVACARCHPSGRSLRVRHERCTDCHADHHLGQFARRADQGRCESCHDLRGFAPARFTLEDHLKSGYPLEGAHRAVPCDACHRRLSAPSLPAGGVRLVGTRGSAPSPDGRAPTVFRFAGTRCADCHADPHRGEVDRRLPKGGCEQCHGVEAWSALTFDHARTRFPLTGGHDRRACGECHPRVDKGTPRERVRLTGLSLECASCHRDPHAGQFATASGPVACDRCHTTTDVRASRFDHNRDSAYPLDGAHAKVRCGACHPTEARAGARVVRYKPLGRACKDCHLSEKGATP